LAEMREHFEAYPALIRALSGMRQSSDI
jgi:hypothetical protein